MYAIRSYYDFQTARLLDAFFHHGAAVVPVHESRGEYAPERRAFPQGLDRLGGQFVALVPGPDLRNDVLGKYPA